MGCGDGAWIGRYAQQLSTSIKNPALKPIDPPGSHPIEAVIGMHNGRPPKLRVAAPPNPHNHAPSKQEGLEHDILANSKNGHQHSHLPAFGPGLGGRQPSSEASLGKSGMEKCAGIAKRA